MSFVFNVGIRQNHPPPPKLTPLVWLPQKKWKLKLRLS